MTIVVMETVVSVGAAYVSKGEGGIHGDVMPVTLSCGHSKLMMPCHCPAGTRLRCYTCEDARKAARRAAKAAATPKVEYTTCLRCDGDGFGTSWRESNCSACGGGGKVAVTR